MVGFINNFKSIDTVEAALFKLNSIDGVMQSSAGEFSSLFSLSNFEIASQSYSNTAISIRLVSGETIKIGGSGFSTSWNPKVTSLVVTTPAGAKTAMYGSVIYYSNSDSVSGTLSKLIIEDGVGSKITLIGSGDVSFEGGFAASSIQLDSRGVSLILSGEMTYNDDAIALSGQVSRIKFISGRNYFTLDELAIDINNIDIYLNDPQSLLQVLLQGNDYLVGGSSGDILYGLAGNDSIEGLGGNDTLDGGTGDDSLIGGIGNDLYIVNNAADMLVEQTNAGIDTVKIDAGFTLDEEIDEPDYTLGDNIEHIDASSFTGGIYLEGNSLANNLTGGNGNDTLDGADGVDTLKGGLGNDTYHVDLKITNAGKSTATVSLQDTLTELANQGTDTINLVGTVSDLAKASLITIAANVENLDASATGSTWLDIKGNAEANYIIGNDADNILDGLTGNDTLEGGAGNDTLIGGAGADSLIGGIGNDVYVVNIIKEGASIVLEDEVFEEEDEGLDTLSLTGSIKLTSAATLSVADYANIENIDISGTKSTLINLTGNDEANLLKGNAAANTLSGGLGNDTLDGLTGADIMIGGEGDDTYYVDNKLDVVTELEDEGTDTVYSNLAAYTLADNVEHLVLDTKGSAGTGNALDNTITGNAKANTLNGGLGNDTIYGGLGNDKLTGGEGADVFVFDTNLKSNIDTITDFTVGEDEIWLDDAIFSALGGAVTADNFLSVTKLKDATVQLTSTDGYLIYENSTGKLYYDADGSGSGKAIQFATLAKLSTGFPELAPDGSDFGIIS